MFGVLVFSFLELFGQVISIRLPPHLQGPSADLQTSAMASIRKKLTMAFGLNGQGPPSTSKARSSDPSRSSIDSGYHSMIAEPKCESQDSISQATTFMTSGTESSPERSPKRLHKAISSTFSGAMQAFSNTVRSTTSYIYPTAGEPELPSSEWAECETPKKESRRSSIKSSIRSRRQQLTPRAARARIDSPEVPQPRLSVTQEKAPALDVEIPNASFSYESLEKVSASNGSQLLAGVKLPAGPKNLWPGPTRLTAEQASGIKIWKTPHRATSKFDDPYVEQGARFQHGLSLISSSEFALESQSPKTNKQYMSEENGYFSEVESNADVSEPDGLSAACLKRTASGSPEAATSPLCSHKDPAASSTHIASSVSSCRKTIPCRMSSSVPVGSELSRPKTWDGIAEQTAPLEPPSRRSIHQSSSREDSLSVLLPSYEDAIASKPRSLYKRLLSDVYDADAESLESSMGSRTAWERHRADRERRYMEIVDMAPNTESDKEVEPALELKRLPSRKPVHGAEKLVQSTANTGRSESTLGFATGDLRYAVEAIERPAFPLGDLRYAVEAIERPAFPLGDLRYAVEAIDRPAFPVGDLANAVEAIDWPAFDLSERVFQKQPMLRPNEMIDEPEILQIPDPLDSSLLRMEIPSTPLSDLSSSRVELPSSPESFPLDIPAAPKFTMMTTRLTDEDLMTFGASNLECQNIRQFSSESTDVSVDSSSEYQIYTTPRDAYKAASKAGGSFLPTCLSSPSKIQPVGEDAYEAGLRAAGISFVKYASGVMQTRPVVDSSNERDLNATSVFSPIFTKTRNRTYHEELEVGSTLPKQRSGDGTSTEHSRTALALSDNTDDSRAITTHSPSSTAPPPFPSLHVRSEPARRNRSALDALTTYGDERIRIAGPANAGINPSVVSPFDSPKEEVTEFELNVESGTGLESAESHECYTQTTSPEQHDSRSPSPSTPSSIQSQSNNNSHQETFNAAKLPSFVSPSRIAPRKGHCIQKKNSSDMGTLPYTDNTMDATNTIVELEPDPTRCELQKSSAIDRTQTSLGESARIIGGSVRKLSPNRQLSKKILRNRNQTSFEKFTESAGDSVRWLDPSSDSKSSNKSPGGKEQTPATLPVASSPPRMKLPQARGKTSSVETHENADSAANDLKPHFEPELSIKHFDSMNDGFSLYATEKICDISYASHELDSVLQANSSENSRRPLDEDLQQDNDKEAIHSASSDETTGKDSKSDKFSPRAPGQKRNDKPPPEAEKKFAVQRELERKSDHACSRLVGKLKNRALGDNQAHEEDLAYKNGRPPWRP